MVRALRLLLPPALAVLLLLVLLLLVWAAPFARAEDDATEERDVHARVARWLRELTSDEFGVREAARKGLKREGLGARDLLEAAAQHEDAEVRRTVAAILVRAPGASRLKPAAVGPGDFEALGKISLNVRDKSYAEALALLGEQMGAHFELPEGGRARRVTLKSEPVPCFAALDLLLAAGNLRMVDPFDTAGVAKLVLRKADDPSVPTATAGPMRLRVKEVSATRSFARNAGPRYLVKLELSWAPYVQVSQFRTVRVEVARDPEGRAYKPSPAMRRTVYRGVSTRARHTTLDVHLEPGEEGCLPKLGVLEVSIPLTLRYDRAQVALDDVARMPVRLDTAGKPAAKGADESVEFLSMTPSGDGRGLWVVEYAATLERDVSQRTLQSFVREDDGRLSEIYVAGGRSRGADGTMRITARAYRSNRPAPKSLLVTWHRREEKGELRFRLEDIPLR